MKLSWRHLPLVELILENISTIMGYAFSTPTLEKWTKRFFEGGECKSLGIACFEIPQKRATLALLQLATQLRLLDNYYPPPSYYELDFGKIIKQDGAEEKLYFRDMTNKIMHSTAIAWNFSDHDDPIIICHSDDPARWMRAEIKISSIAFYCGSLQS